MTALLSIGNLSCQKWRDDKVFCTSKVYESPGSSSSSTDLDATSELVPIATGSPLGGSLFSCEQADFCSGTFCDERFAAMNSSPQMLMYDTGTNGSNSIGDIRDRSGDKQVKGASLALR
ncbi:hypothetical protein AKJ16_DCAP08337 [Drosera capensis]